MSRLKALPFFLIVPALALALLFGVGGGFSAQAHDLDDFDFTGEAQSVCVVSGEAWSILWTIENFEGSNPFGIVDTDITDGPAPTFSPLVDDPAPGAYVPAGDSATASTTHASSVTSVSLTVTHDVTEGPDTEFTVTVDRPPLCDDASITVRKVVEGVSNDPTGFNVDFSAGVPDVVGIDENDAPVRRGDLVPGLYILTEYAVPAGYEFVSWVCESDQLGLDADADNAAMDVAISIRSGEDVFCTLTNRPKPPTPTPTATATPTATSTAVITSAAQPTQTPVLIVVPPQIIREVITQAAPAPAPAAPSTIRPPSTGDGGLTGN